MRAAVLTVSDGVHEGTRDDRSGDLLAELLGAEGFDVERRRIQLAEPLKRLGEFDVPVKLYRDVTTTVKVKVVAEGAERK